MSAMFNPPHPGEHHRPARSSDASLFAMLKMLGP